MSEPHRQENFSSLMEFEKYLVGLIPLDRDTDVGSGVTGIDTVHKQIHDSHHYTYSIEGTIGAGTANAVLLTAKPSIGTELHFTAVLTSKSGGWLRLYEDTTVVGGTIVTPKNNDRVHDDTYMAGTLTLGGTVQTWGIRLQSRAIGTYNPIVHLGGEQGERKEWILDEDYKYLIVFVADAASTEFSLDFEAYEVTT